MMTDYLTIFICLSSGAMGGMGALAAMAVQKRAAQLERTGSQDRGESEAVSGTKGKIKALLSYS